MGRFHSDPGNYNEEVDCHFGLSIYVSVTKATVGGRRG